MIDHVWRERLAGRRSARSTDPRTAMPLGPSLATSCRPAPSPRPAPSVFVTYIKHSNGEKVMSCSADRRRTGLQSAVSQQAVPHQPCTGRRSAPRRCRPSSSWSSRCRATASNTIRARSPSARIASTTPLVDLDPEEVIAKIETAGAWMVLKRIEHQPDLQGAAR